MISENEQKVKIGRAENDEGDIEDITTTIRPKGQLVNGHNSVHLANDFADATLWNFLGRIRKVYISQTAVHKYNIGAFYCGFNPIIECNVPKGIIHFICSETLIKELKLPYSIEEVTCPYFTRIVNLEKVREHNPDLELSMVEPVKHNIKYEE